ncbi:Uncharacterised protein [Streptococcus pneumoniae]|nr:Uncharacterised protein [Streptococcus pneumoniae]
MSEHNTRKNHPLIHSKAEILFPSLIHSIPYEEFYTKLLTYEFPLVVNLTRYNLLVPHFVQIKAACPNIYRGVVFLYHKPLLVHTLNLFLLIRPSLSEMHLLPVKSRHRFSISLFYHSLQCTLRQYILMLALHCEYSPFHNL